MSEKNSHNDFESLAAGYVLDALTEEERLQFEEMLKNATPEQLKTYRELSHAKNEIALASSPQSPSDELEDRIFDKIEGGSSRGTGSGSGTASIIPLWTYQLAAALLLVGVIGFAIYNTGVQEDLDRQQMVISELEQEIESRDQLQVELREREQTIAQLQSELEEMERVEDNLREKEALVAQLENQLDQQEQLQQEIREQENLVAQLQDELDRKQNIEEDLQQRDVLITELRDDLERKEQLLSVIAAREVRLVIMGGLDPSPDGYGKVLWDSEQRQAVLQLANIPAPPEDKDYQLWLIKGEQDPISAGVFNFEQPSTDLFFKVEHLDEDPSEQENNFAVTLEPKGGMPQPTGDMFLFGQQN